MNSRSRRTLSIEGVSWDLVDAWRASAGRGLGYFIAPTPGDDRRAALDPGVDILALPDDDARALWDQAASLTTTERRVTAGDDLWLAQASGPVWAEGAAAGIIGVRFTCLTSDLPVREVGGVVLGDLTDEELATLLAAPMDDPPEAAHTDE